MRLRFRKESVDPWPVVTDVLEAPAGGESAMLDAVRKTGGDEDVQRAAAIASRALGAIIESYGGRLPDEVVKAIDRQRAEPAKPDTGELLQDGDIPPWFLHEIELARQADPSLRDLADDTVMAQLLAAHPEWVDDEHHSAREAWEASAVKKGSLRLRTPEERARIAEEARRTNKRVRKPVAERSTVVKKETPRRSAAESLAEIELISKDLQRHTDENAEAAIERRAAALRHADPSLSKPQAVAKAVEQDPELYEGYRRHLMRQAGGLNDDSRTLRKAREQAGALNAAADELRKADPDLTDAQAVVQALENNPSLYGGKGAS